MKRLFALPLIIAGCVSCAVQQSDDGHYRARPGSIPKGNYISSTSVQYDAGNQLVLMPSKKMFVTFDEINKIYVETEQCMGLYASGPTVWFVNFQDYQNGLYNVTTAGTGSWGLSGPGTGVPYMQAAGMISDFTPTYTTPGFVFINNNDHIVAGIDWNYRDYETDVQVLKHEFVHHIIRENGGTDDHSSHGLVGGVNYFEKCGMGVNVNL